MPATFLASQNTEDQTPQEITVDNPQTEAMAEESQRKAVEEEESALKQIRLQAKQSWASKRQALVRRVLRAFEYLKNNPYAVFNEGSGELENIAQVVSGSMSADDPDLYQHNDNVYQMLCLSFMAALGPDVSKTRWMPDDPQEEQDTSFAKQASTMEAFIERINDMPSLQMMKLLYLWTAGTYFAHIRNVVDANKAGVTRTPVYGMKDVEVFPNRYLCGNCGTPNPEKQYNPAVHPTCFDCGSNLQASDWYPAESMPMPTQVDEIEQANSFTGINIYCLLNVDVDPDAQELAQTPILDLEGEMNIAAVRAAYPARYTEISAGKFGDDTTGATQDRLARELVTSPTTARAMTGEERRGSFSRCWIQPWAFYGLDDQALAQRLLKKYPKGVKLVTYGNDLVLETRPESLLEHWTECRTIKGLGMNPFGVGDIALSVQDRVDDTANNIHIYMDRMALPPVLANAALVDVNALGKNRWSGGRTIPVFPSLKTPGLRFNMQEVFWQPTFHADTKIYDYSQTLIMLMQLLTGVQPQIFGGGTTRGVDTASGQQQQLNTAMGRLMLFLTSMRSEGARGAKLAVKCMAEDIDGQKRIVMEGEVEGEYENAYILESEVQGEIHAYPQSDQGFPASYGEMRDRLIQILGMVENNPVLQDMLSSGDTKKLFAMYLLPPGAKMADESQTEKTKKIIQQLAAGAPSVMQDPQTGQAMTLPSIQPDPAVDNLQIVVNVAKEWLVANWQIATSNPNGYANVRSFIVLTSSIAEQQAAKVAALQASAGQPAAAGAGGAAGAQAAA